MMASAPSMSVSVECVNVCMFPKGDGSGRYDCSVVSCKWKAPRALTGFLASTSSCGHTERSNSRHHRCEASGRGAWLPSDISYFLPRQRFLRSNLLHLACRERIVGCLASFPSGHDEVSPEHLWEDLKPAIAYLPSDELKFVRNALDLAFEAHDGQKRRSGEPFIIHPVEVARILGELELDWESIAAGLLHDTVEDTNVVTFERIQKEFGETVRRIVEGETKVSKLGKLKCKNESGLGQDMKAHDLQQMFVAMTEEPRVIIVKVADRLHNMRTLSHMPSHKQASIAMETLQVFAPLAKLLGMYQIKSELENLSFKYTDPKNYAEVKRQVAKLYKEHEKEIEEANKILVKRMEDDQFLDMTMKAEVRSVCKEPYSIYKSVLKANGEINEVNQIAQLRIIVKPKPGVGVGPLCNAQQICYHVLGLVHGIWTPIPQSMKDYIATPKPNNYQSLHTTVIPFLYESMFRVEVQIRTEEMNLIAERGFAAQYSGKVFVNGLARQKISNDRNLKIGWLNAIREWQEEFIGNVSSRDFVDTVTKDLFSSRVFVFTPRGEIKNLPKGATVIDYAYMIHTEIGNRMVYAKVNGNFASPVHVLANAEVVEIVTYNPLSSKYSLEKHKNWLQHAKTRSAQHKIKKFLMEQGALIEGVLDHSKQTPHICEKTPMNFKEMSSPKITEDLSQFKNGSIKVPKVNGKHNKHMQHVSLKANEEMLSQGNGVAKLTLANMPYKEVFPGVESWRARIVASWSNREGHSIQWLCIVCVDRRSSTHSSSHVQDSNIPEFFAGRLPDITVAVADAGVKICSCAAEVNDGRGMALFHVEASVDSLVNACSRVDLFPGVLGWSTGCSYPCLPENQLLREC